MTYLLDSNACIHHLRQPQTSPITAKLAAAAPGTVTVCSVVVSELLFGALRSARPQENLSLVGKFVGNLVSWPFDDLAADHCAQVRDHLARAGNTIGPNDAMIAAIALANNLTVVTHNTSEFSRVPNLLIEDWQADN